MLMENSDISEYVLMCTSYISKYMLIPIPYISKYEVKLNQNSYISNSNSFPSFKLMCKGDSKTFKYEPRHEISSNVVCVTSKASDQPAHRRSLIRAFASRLNILAVLSY